MDGRETVLVSGAARNIKTPYKATPQPGRGQLPQSQASCGLIAGVQKTGGAYHGADENGAQAGRKGRRVEGGGRAGWW